MTEADRSRVSEYTLCDLFRCELASVVLLPEISQKPPRLSRTSIPFNLPWRHRGHAQPFLLFPPVPNHSLIYVAQLGFADGRYRARVETPRSFFGGIGCEANHGLYVSSWPGADIGAKGALASAPDPELT